MQSNKTAEVNKIAFYDSGLGGLTVLEQFVEPISHQKGIDSKSINQYLYFADTKNLPYGDKTTEQLTSFLTESLRWLEDKVDTVVIACNSCSGLANESLKKEFPKLKIVGLLDALVSYFSDSETQQGLVGNSFVLLTTEATKRIGRYQKELLPVLGSSLRVLACPKLVPFIEDEGEELNPLKAEELIKELKAELQLEPDFIILGCSHYPLLKKSFNKVFPKTHLIDPAELMMNLVPELKNKGQNTLIETYVSGEPSKFKAKLNSLTKSLNCAKHLRNIRQVS